MASITWWPPGELRIALTKSGVYFNRAATAAIRDAGWTGVRVGVSRAGMMVVAAGPMHLQKIDRGARLRLTKRDVQRWLATHGFELGTYHAEWRLVPAICDTYVFVTSVSEKLEEGEKHDHGQANPRT